MTPMVQEQIFKRDAQILQVLNNKMFKSGFYKMNRTNKSTSSSWMQVMFWISLKKIHV